MERRIYKSHIGLVIYNGMLRGILTGLAMFIIYLAVLWNTKWMFQVNTSIAIWIAALLGNLAYAFVKRRKCVELHGDEITLSGGKERGYKFSMTENEIGTFVEIHGLAGIVLSITRYLNINGEKHICHNFSRRSFSEMTAKIERLQRHAEDLNKTQPFEAVKAFAIPRAILLKNEKQKSIQFYIECLIVSVVMVVAWYLGVYRRDVAAGDYLFVVPTVMLVVFLAAPVVWQMIDLHRYGKRLPECIRLAGQELKVDEKVFSLYQIRRISMTPASYVRAGQYSFRRVLKIEDSKTAYRYYLGNTSDKDLKYEEYQALQEYLARACHEKHIPFILEL